MQWQSVCVGIVVTLCSIYVCWVLMPGAIKFKLVRALEHIPLPAVVRQALARSRQSKSGCANACHGCSSASELVKPVAVYRRR